MESPSPIHNLNIKKLVSHGDDRGFFREIIRGTDPFFPSDSFGQWSHSRMQKNVVKAWHYHHLQTDWWYLPIGAVRTVLIDNREESPTFGRRLELLMGEDDKYPGAESLCVSIPPGVLHACKVLTEEAHLFYITSRTYDPKDEGRVAYNSPSIGYDWGEDVIVSAQDTRDFVPQYERKSL